MILAAAGRRIDVWRHQFGLLLSAHNAVCWSTTNTSHKLRHLRAVAGWNDSPESCAVFITRTKIHRWRIYVYDVDCCVQPRAACVRTVSTSLGAVVWPTSAVASVAVSSPSTRGRSRFICSTTPAWRHRLTSSHGATSTGPTASSERPYFRFRSSASTSDRARTTWPWPSLPQYVTSTCLLSLTLSVTVQSQPCRNWLIRKSIRFRLNESKINGAFLGLSSCLPAQRSLNIMSNDLV